MTILNIPPLFISLFSSFLDEHKTLLLDSMSTIDSFSPQVGVCHLSSVSFYSDVDTTINMINIFNTNKLEFNFLVTLLLEINIFSHINM